MPCSNPKGLARHPCETNTALKRGCGWRVTKGQNSYKSSQFTSRFLLLHTNPHTYSLPHRGIRLHRRILPPAAPQRPTQSQGSYLQRPHTTPFSRTYASHMTYLLPHNHSPHTRTVRTSGPYTFTCFHTFTAIPHSRAPIHSPPNFSCHDAQCPGHTAPRGHQDPTECFQPCPAVVLTYLILQ